jgi:hypothetical protein
LDTYFLGVTLQIASSFLLATAGRAVRCNLCIFKEKYKGFSLPSLTQSNPLMRRFFNKRKKI